jgi:glyoxylase-like metal-dependent hydrolase (beta-lactamase superfamily II)
VVGPPPATWEVDPSAASGYEVLEGVWRLRLPTPWPHVSHANAYALERADGGIVLVDAGCGGHESTLESLRTALGQAGRTVADVRDLVVTHFHSDHIGTVARLVPECGCTVWAHPDAEHFMGVWRSPEPHMAARERMAREMGVPPELVPDVGDVREETDGIDGDFDVHRFLAAGLTLQTRAGDWKVVETPGHAPSAVCLFQRDRNVLIAGDLVGPVLAPFFDLGFTPDPVAEHLASLRTVRGLGPEIVLPGHGGPIADADAVLEENEAAITARIREVEEAVADGPCSGYQLFVRRFGERADRAERVWRLWELAAYLHHLVQQGRLVGSSGSDGVLRYAPAQR